MKNFNNHGISLIALIITIIVLLILAGITLNITLGESGLFIKAQNAKEKTIIKNAEEIIKLSVLKNTMDENNSQYIDITQLVENIAQHLKSEGYHVENDNNTVSAGQEKIKISDYIGDFNSYAVTFNAPKNSIITLNYKGNVILEKQITDTSNNITINVYKELGDKITALSKINNNTIYEKSFELQENNVVNMYPCEENGDGRALYWYGIEFSNFEEDVISYSTTPFSQPGSCTRNDNSINLYFNDTFYAAHAGIGINYKEDLTNYNDIFINIENLNYSGFGIAKFFVGDVPNNYYYVESEYIEDTISESGKLLSNGIKNIPISDITGFKYISLANFNPAGGGPYAYGLVSFDISSIVLK